jgi:hypothetical protein
MCFVPSPITVDCLISNPVSGQIDVNRYSNIQFSGEDISLLEIYTQYEISVCSVLSLLTSNPVREEPMLIDILDFSFQVTKYLHK